jgi:hypothetical protein
MSLLLLGCFYEDALRDIRAAALGAFGGGG